MKSQFEIINQKKLHFLSFGNSKNPPIFMIPGWMDIALSFKYLASYLEKDYYCIALDLRGYGKSESNLDPLGYSFYQYVADVWKLIEKLYPKDQVAILGHSLGGMISTVLAGTNPDKFSHLINLEGFLVRDRKASEAPKRLKDWFNEIDHFQPHYYSSIDELKEKLISKNHYLKDLRAKELATYLLNKDNDQFILNLDHHHRMVEPHLMMMEVFQSFVKNLKAQCLLIASLESEMRSRLNLDTEDYQTELSKRLKWFPKNTELFWLEKGFHNFHHTHDHLIGPKILDFLSK
jgi:pimeloyl-ACP methyl ester carboxylesterase